MSKKIRDSQLKNQLKAIINQDFNYKTLSKDKNIAQLGDSLVNFLFSLSVSLVKGKFCGLRAPDSILASAFHGSKIKEIIPSRGKKQIIGDIVEAIILLFWLSNEMDLEDMIEILTSNMEITLQSSRKEEFIAATNGFQKLLDEIAFYLNDLGLNNNI